MKLTEGSTFSIIILVVIVTHPDGISIDEDTAQDTMQDGPWNTFRHPMRF